VVTGRRVPALRRRSLALFVWRPSSLSVPRPLEAIRGRGWSGNTSIHALFRDSADFRHVSRVEMSRRPGLDPGPLAVRCNISLSRQEASDPGFRRDDEGRRMSVLDAVG
jgi:hypothetical protein